MKGFIGSFLGLFLLVIPLVAFSQYSYTTNADGTTCTITGYNGTNGAMVIPAKIKGLTVVSLGDHAFAGFITNVGTIYEIIPDSVPTSVVIPGTVTDIGEGTFEFCDNLTNAYFAGNAPASHGYSFADTPATVDYLPGTTGWTATFDGSYPTAWWFLPYPVILHHGPGFGLTTNGFGFTISWATNLPVVVAACTNLVNPLWTPVVTNTLSAGTSMFSDPNWAAYPVRFFRLGTP